jgi:membrane protein implicated in regulation of membrane protease activity
MIYNSFQSNPMQNRFSGSRGWLAFIIGLAFMTLALVALPFLLLFGAITFMALSLFGRVYLKRQLARFNKQQAGQKFQKDDVFQENVSRENTSQSTAAGRIFEHNPNE